MTKHPRGLGMHFNVGSDHPGAKLTEDKVREIRVKLRSVPRKVIAATFGVSEATIGAIARNEKWNHVKD